MSDQRADQPGRAVLWAVLTLGVLAILLPAVMLGQPSRVALLKLGVAGLLSFIPGWLYLAFLRHRGPSLYDEYVLNLFRLHIDEYRNLPMPPAHTSYYTTWKREHDDLDTDTSDNLYRRKFESVYGRNAVSTIAAFTDPLPSRASTETFSPVLLATVLLSIGWVLVLQPELLSLVELFGDLPLSGRPQVPIEALTFGFVGAYAFVLGDLVRRYFRDDLKAGAYVSVVSRVVVVMLLVATLHLVWVGSASTEAVFAFFVGFFPQSGFQALRAALPPKLRRLVRGVDAGQPLSQLEGLTIWYEARLTEEGIEDLQNLVTANLVDVLLRSRVPVCRLVDWLDQAFLLLHPPAKSADARTRLRELGIRGATDLERGWHAMRNDKGFHQALGTALGVETAAVPSRINAALRGLEGENNYWHVQQFKRHEWLLRDGQRQSSTVVALSPAKAG
ncbi:MAG: hypothetical protein ACRDU8_01795 [Egibacteraceae bacterium]